MVNLRGKRGALFAITVAMALLVACGPGEICENESDKTSRELSQQMMRDAAAKAVASPAATSAATAAATATGTAAPVATAATVAAFGGKVALGFDHPPFAAPNANVGGNSVGIVCGNVTGAPGGSIITINLTGGTAAPASVKGPIGGDGTFLIPFPIMSFGPLNAAVGGIAGPTGTALTGSIPPASLPVAGGPDVACMPR